MAADFMDAFKDLTARTPTIVDASVALKTRGSLVGGFVRDLASWGCRLLRQLHAQHAREPERAVLLHLL